MLKFKIIACVAKRPSCLSKPFTKQGVGSGVKATFKNFAKSVAY
jgi:hypothetical protein